MKKQILVIFGGGGDLAKRKLLPALYHLAHVGLLDNLDRIIGIGRTVMSRDDYVKLMHISLKEHVDSNNWNNATWRIFAEHLEYYCVDALRSDNYAILSDTIGSNHSAVFYLATLPSLYGAICKNLEASHLVNDESRVVLEKPLGNNEYSCKEIHRSVADVFPERNIFRIDHYLGKETVQNLIAVRLGNPIFSHMWNNQYIDHVQITVAESLGIEGRGAFYACTGALRDMVQNHILQLLCVVAMEPHNSLDADSIRDEKVKVLKCLRPITPDTVKQFTVRGQYSAGRINDNNVPGYREEPNTHSGGDTETFTAIRGYIDNWRWAGVPFYLRTGKRLGNRFSEIVINFKAQSFSIFPKNAPSELNNKLVIRLQPEENITLCVMSKKPDLESGRMTLYPTELNLTLEDNGERQHDAYERLLLDVINKDQTLFMRRDEVEYAWRWIDTIIDSWESSGLKCKPYKAGEMGPSAAVSLIERDGRSWHE